MKLVLNIVGMLIVLAICFLISWDRKNVEWKKVGIALIAEIIIAIIIVKVPLGQKLISLLSNGLTAVINCGNEGLTFVFGDLFTGNMSIFIIKSLGNIIFVSALVSVLYYLGVIGFVVKWIGKGVGKLMGTTEVESFVAVANMFLGHTDSPILVSKRSDRQRNLFDPCIRNGKYVSIYPWRIPCIRNPNGILTDRECDGTTWKYHDLKDHFTSDRKSKIHHRCKNG